MGGEAQRCQYRIPTHGHMHTWISTAASVHTQNYLSGCYSVVSHCGEAMEERVHHMSLVLGDILNKCIGYRRCIMGSGGSSAAEA